MVAPSAVSLYPMAKSRRQSEAAIVPATIARAIVHIGAHPAVAGTQFHMRNGQTGTTDVLVSIRVNLPTEWLPHGQSPTGVKAVEQVVFRFGPNYPFVAPAVRLRHDFNRALPHIQPGSAGEPVTPCYYDGVPDELLQQGGIIAIVDQVAVWLQRAAFDDLIDPAQGWEPTRRDNIQDYLIADTESLQRWVSNKERVHIFHVDYTSVKYQATGGANIPRQLYAKLRENPQNLTRSLVCEAFTPSQRDEFQCGRSFAMLVCPGSSDGMPVVIERYSPESISTWPDLLARSEELGCPGRLQQLFKQIQAMSAGMKQPVRIPLFIILAVRRPVRLIGCTSSIEFLPYVMWVTSPITNNTLSTAFVQPVAHRYAITQMLLRKMSGTKMKMQNLALVQIGCGSLGSKISLHLARAGLAPNAVIDKDSLSPHNAARHGLLPYVSPMTDAVDALMFSKAKLLAHAISSLGKDPRAVSCDAIELVSRPTELTDLFAANTVAINSTASLAVRECLSSTASTKIQSRIIETALYGRGTVGLMTVEGEGRNPNSNDLIAEAYVLMREQPKMQAVVFSEQAGLERQSIGQGCGSATMVMSDARLSMFASAMAERIGGLLQGSLPVDGEIMLGQIGDDGMSVSWVRTVCHPFIIIPPSNATNWTVRLSLRAHAKITAEVASYPSVETGGILIGYVSEAGQTITIADVLPAPVDSERSTGQFVLGVNGVSDLLAAYTASTQRALYCVGTWHSHLREGGASRRDYETARIIGDAQLSPSVLIIKTPTLYRAILAGELP